jgi:hypothetical protein
MAFRFKTFAIALVALLLAVPTGALAKGKPSWAGGNGGGHGKPAWAGQGHGKADKAKGHGKAAHEKKAKEKQNGRFGATDGEGADDPDDLSLEDLEALEAIHAPGQYCHALESFQESLAGMWGGDSFDERFGENANLANSHGKCASWRAQGGSLEEDQAEEEQPTEDSCEPAGDEEGTEEGSEDPAEDCEAEEESEPSLDDLEAISSPGQYCHMLEALEETFAGFMGDESFDEHFGENANLANSHGKCASWRAQGGSLQEDAADEEQPAGDEASENEDQASEEPAEDSCEPAEGVDAADEGSEDADSEEGSDEPAEECDGQDQDEDEEEESEGDESGADDSFLSSFDLARLSF